MQDPDMLRDVTELENSFISDVANILRESWMDLTPEQKQDLIDFELGKLEFESLFSKYWNEDGSWKDQLAGLEDMFQGFVLDTRATVTEDNAEAETSSSPTRDKCNGQDDTVEASEDDMVISDEDNDIAAVTYMDLD